MKQSLTYKFAAIFLSALVLFSSLSFSIEKHFCEGETNISFFSDAKDLCEMDSHKCHTDKVITSSCDVTTEKSDCCIDTSEFIQGITLEQQAQARQVLKYHPVVVLTSDFFTTNLLSKRTSISEVYLFKPILESLDIRLLYQVFRI